MADSPLPEPQFEAQIDWDDTRLRLQATIRSHLGRVTSDELDDLAAEAQVQLLRRVRQEGARNLFGLIKVIGRTTAIDEIRRRQREAARRLDWEGHLDKILELPSRMDEWDDRFQTLWFLMIEYFRTRKAPCRSLALEYSERGDWKAVAEARGLAYAAVRQQWSRCARAFRDELRRSPGVYDDWAGEDV